MLTTNHVGLRLGRPISVNAMYRAVSFHGRVMNMKSSKYRSWEAEQKALLMQQKPPHISGEYSVIITLPQNYRGDIDGACKAFLDLLQNTGVTENDRNCSDLRISRGVEKNITSILVLKKQ
jgi:Holliday junction resolvase RusA-like endonuclease